MMLCNCIDFEFSFYYRYRVVWSIKMESDSISNAAAIANKENDIAKRVHLLKVIHQGNLKIRHQDYLVRSIQDLVGLRFIALENHQR